MLTQPDKYILLFCIKQDITVLSSEIHHLNKMEGTTHSSYNKLFIGRFKIYNPYIVLIAICVLLIWIMVCILWTCFVQQLLFRHVIILYIYTH